MTIAVLADRENVSTQAVYLYDISDRFNIKLLNADGHPLDPLTLNAETIDFAAEDFAAFYDPAEDRMKLSLADFGHTGQIFYTFSDLTPITPEFFTEVNRHLYDNIVEVPGGISSDLTAGLGANMSASSSTGGNTPDLAVDDNSSTYWEADGQIVETLEIDFGAGNEQTINTISILPGGTTVSRLKNFRFEGSKDNLEWEILFKGQHTDSLDAETFSFFNTTPYRYYRVFAVDSHDGAANIEIKEVEYFNNVSRGFSDCLWEITYDAAKEEFTFAVTDFAYSPTIDATTFPKKDLFPDDKFFQSNLLNVGSGGDILRLRDFSSADPSTITVGLNTYSLEFENLLFEALQDTVSGQVQNKIKIKPDLANIDLDLLDEIKNNGLSGQGFDFFRGFTGKAITIRDNLPIPYKVPNVAQPTEANPLGASSFVYWPIRFNNGGHVDRGFVVVQTIGDLDFVQETLNEFSTTDLTDGLGSSLTASSTTSSNVVSRAVDNFTSTQWESASNTNENIIVDFGVDNEQQVGAIALHPGGITQSSIAGFSIEGSATGAFGGEETSIASFSHSSVIQKEKFYFTNAISYRYYRIVFASGYDGSNIAVKELELFDTEVEPVGSVTESVDGFVNYGLTTPNNYILPGEEFFKGRHNIAAAFSRMCILTIEEQDSGEFKEEYKPTPTAEFNQTFAAASSADFIEEGPFYAVFTAGSAQVYLKDSNGDDVTSLDVRRFLGKIFILSSDGPMGAENPATWYLVVDGFPGGDGQNGYLVLAQFLSGLNIYIPGASTVAPGGDEFYTYRHRNIRALPSLAMASNRERGNTGNYKNVSDIGIGMFFGFIGIPNTEGRFFQNIRELQTEVISDATGANNQVFSLYDPEVDGDDFYEKYTEHKGVVVFGSDPGVSKLYAPFAFENIGVLSKTFAPVVGLSESEEDSEEFRKEIAGAMYAFAHGANIDPMEVGLTIFMNVPSNIEEPSRIVAINDRVDVTVDNFNGEFTTIPLKDYPIRSDLREGDELAPFEPLTESITVKDEQNNPRWWDTDYITILSPIAEYRQIPQLKQAQRRVINEILKHNTFGVDINANVIRQGGATSLSKINDFIQEIKPEYSYAVVYSTMSFKDEPENLIMEDGIDLELRIVIAATIISNLRNRYATDDSTLVGPEFDMSRQNSMGIYDRVHVLRELLSSPGNYTGWSEADSIFETSTKLITDHEEYFEGGSFKFKT